MWNLSIVLLCVISSFPRLKFIMTWINQLITWLNLNIKYKKKKKITLVLLYWLILLCNDFIRFTLCMQSYSRAMMNITLGKHCLFSIGFRHSLRYISYNTPSDSKKKKVGIFNFFREFSSSILTIKPSTHTIKTVAATASSIQFLPLILCFKQLAVHVMNPA